MVELIPVDEAFASLLEYLLKALPLWLFFNENSLFSEQKRSFLSTGLVSDHFWVRQSDSDDDFFQINSNSIQIYSKLKFEFPLEKRKMLVETIWENPLASIGLFTLHEVAILKKKIVSLIIEYCSWGPYKMHLAHLFWTEIE